MKIKIQTKTAPKWFLECQKTLKKVKDDSGKILGVSSQWLDQHENKNLDLVKNFNLKFDEALKFKLLLQFYNSLSDIMWTKFRLDNLTNEWSTASNLKYDPEKKKVVMYKSTFVILKEILSKLMKDCEPPTA